MTELIIQLKNIQLSIPYAIFVSAGNDGTNAAKEIDRIALGYPLKKVFDPVIVKGEIDESDKKRCEELWINDFICYLPRYNLNYNSNIFALFASINKSCARFSFLLLITPIFAFCGIKYFSATLLRSICPISNILFSEFGLIFR